MNSIMVDECIQNLFYAQEAMKEWVPLTDYEIIFEASKDSKMTETVAKNEEVEKKATNFVQKAINAVITLIKKVYGMIKEFIDRCTMSGPEREAFNAFRKAIAEDPTLKNKKVTVADFRKINDTYDKLINEIDASIRAVKTNESHPVDELVKKVTDFTKGTVTAASVMVSADLAIKLADSNVIMAKSLSKLLNDEEKIMEGLSKSLGEKQAKKFKKEIDAAAKNTILHRLKVKLFRHKYEGLRDCIRGTIDTLTHAGFKNVGEVKKAQKDLKAERKAGTISKEDYKKQMAELNDAKKKAKKEVASSIELDKKVVDNPHTGPIVKTIGKAAVTAGTDIAKDKASTWIQDHITDRNRKKRDATKNEIDSLLDFIKK